MIAVGLCILVAFIVGFCLGLMGIALASGLRREAAEHDSCFGQSGPSSSTG
jgi:hypothetical protein